MAIAYREAMRIVLASGPIGILSLQLRGPLKEETAPLRDAEGKPVELIRKVGETQGSTAVGVAALFFALGRMCEREKE